MNYLNYFYDGFRPKIIFKPVVGHFIEQNFKRHKILLTQSVFLKKKFDYYFQVHNKKKGKQKPRKGKKKKIRYLTIFLPC